MKNRTLLELYESFKQTICFYFTYEESSLIKVLNFMHDQYFLTIDEYVQIMNDIYFKIKIKMSTKFEYDLLVRFIDQRINKLK